MRRAVVFAGIVAAAIAAAGQSRPASVAQGLDVLSLAAQVAPLETGYVVPRTPWGDPDIEGKWPSIDMVRVPVQRQARYGVRIFLTPAEAAEREAGEKVQIERMAAEGAGGATGAPGHWVEWGRTQRQSSLLIDPPDGRMPALTPEGQARAAAAPRGTMGPGPFNGPEDFTMWERCLSRGALGSTLPVLYNSGIDITQGPGFVGIRYEMVHDHRVIPLDRRSPLAPALRQYVGDARGHWEGDTLVVESRNFTDNKVGLGLSGGGAPASAALTLVERFTRVGPRTIRYVATVHDPLTYTRDWTVAFPLTLQPDYGMHEYACHEGNYGLVNALSGARAAERVGER